MGQIIAIEDIAQRICFIRGVKVLLDRDLAVLYEVETKRLKEQVKRNLDRFPTDFMFELTKEEFHDLRSQFATSSWGGPRYVPMAFTEQGVAMLSSILRSKRAIQVNVQIMRAFVKLRQLINPVYKISFPPSRAQPRDNQFYDTRQISRILNSIVSA